ncbi:ADP-ribosylation factor GTPase-activating protein AGD12-like [Iris pallida]|uniref:ADP-ribosylation factor GTPase-activating protein AGD12-like n=1 Tax=Iris pallida TaxID=29817 RepID=A0AAX6E7M1_IRIPA|nr:ADP-ribosylation factor GTPase-activating protein AGD12-like [Iris pallida]
MSNQYYEYRKPTQGNSRKLKDLLVRSDNRICADCSAPDPKWASANIGVFICLKCSDVHKSLGTDISKVLSVTLDEWSDNEIDSMIAVGGNSYANSIYEAFLPKGTLRPKADSSNEDRTKFIRSKYEFQEFLKPSLRIVSTKSSFGYDSGENLDKSSGSVSSRKQESMGEFIGKLKVKVIRGTNLAVRDFRTSDPYVILTLGQQMVQTSVKESDLNPVWNEELILSVPRRHGALKLQVFDHDTFSADDMMGEAEVNLQLLITAALELGDLDQLEDMQFGKWTKSNENALAKDSTINVVDGKLKQEASLILQNVESGEVAIGLEWIPLD